MHIQSVHNNRTPQFSDLQFFYAHLDSLNLETTPPPMEEQFVIRILKQKALHYDVPYERIYERLKSVFNQNQLNTLRTNQEFIPIYFGNQIGSLQTILQNATIFNTQDQTIPLKEFIEVKKKSNYKLLTAGKAGEALNIPLENAKQDILPKIKQRLQQRKGFVSYFTGAFFDNQLILKELNLVLAVVLCLLYLILAAQFESLMLPFIVLATVPVGIAGALFVLYWMGQSFNLVSIIGIIVMSGIVVNDAILKVDMMQQARPMHNLKEVIHIAGQRRLRPIIMTSLTTLLALSPITFSSGLGAELQRPLAYAIIGGLIAGTIASLYFIPIIYYLFSSINIKTFS